MDREVFQAATLRAICRLRGDIDRIQKQLDELAEAADTPSQMTDGPRDGSWTDTIKISSDDHTQL